MKTTDKDPWKALVDQNKESFNQRKPKDLWASIEQELEQNKKKTPKLISIWMLYKVAVVFIIALGLGYFMIYNHFSVAPVADNKEEKNIEETIYPKEFVEAESYYAAEINQKLNEVIALVDDKTLIEEVDLLRLEFEDLRSEMGDNINDERIVEAMIQNYRLRLELLKEILDEVRLDYKSEKNKKHESESI